MDDLYGDLPPAATGSNAVDQSNKFFQGGALKISAQLVDGKKSLGNNKTEQKNTLQSNPTAKEDDLKTNEHDQTKPTKSTISKTKFIPSTLMFKPRQTSAATATTSTISNTMKNEPSSITQREKEHTLLEIQPSTILTKENQRTKSENVFEEVRFNNNDSFDVPDPYDPRRPNDYLQYCAECDEQKRIRVIAEDNKRKMEEMERQRVELENQKRELAEKQDYKRLLELSASSQAVNANSLLGEGLGRGRGRGVVNLPAWMTQQIKVNDPAPASDLPVSDRFDDAVIMETSEDVQTLTQQKRKFSMISKPSKVLLLKNFVEQRDVDEGLKNELITECTKYGSVSRCEIYIVDSGSFPSFPSSELVRVFVEFERQDAAIKALRDLQGRFFGGRKIQALFFDEGKFKANRLDPDDEDLVGSSYD